MPWKVTRNGRVVRNPVARTLNLFLIFFLVLFSILFAIALLPITLPLHLLLRLFGRRGFFHQKQPGRWSYVIGFGAFARA